MYYFCLELVLPIVIFEWQLLQSAMRLLSSFVPPFASGRM